jgi:DNA processing protein
MSRRIDVDRPIWRLNEQHRCWPDLWKVMDDPPKLISGTGRRSCLNSPMLAIVGTRKATGRGLVLAHKLAFDLAKCGWVIVSGLARGIDSAAHRGALAAGGRTVAVMANGIDRTYPAENAGLRREIETEGCVFTEEADGAPPLRYTFPKRNRLVAGIARGVVVIEAPLRSGAMLTAMQAADQGREVFAVPGPVDRIESRGCHHLLKQGAALLETIDDIHHLLPPPVASADGEEVGLPAAGSPARWIWDRLDLTGMRLSELRRMWAGTGQVFAEGLMALEMDGLIHRLPGGMVARRIWIPDP